MGANPTQAFALAVFLIAFVMLGAAFASGGSVVWFLGFAVALAAAIALFRKCKPWEHLEE